MIVKKTLLLLPFGSKQLHYREYKKKIFAIVKRSTITTEALEQFKKSLHFKNLKWTIEIEKNGRLNFLDVTVHRGENKISTSPKLTRKG